MKHNEHFMAWLKSMRDEANRPETTMTRIVEIFSCISKYATCQ
ncbi:hypothetical protein RW675_11960 [Klebsiella aerogenes]|nr:hypothetical protein [Klebsiella aerogenes]MDU9141264.1 hypothetical protein [Klebsiella aerogenes]